MTATTNVAELAQTHISRVEELRKEWEAAQANLDRIEGELRQLVRMNGHASTNGHAKRAQPTIGEGRINKAEAIRQYHSEHKDARPKDIIKALSDQGVEVSPAAVWQALNHLPTGKRGRPPKSKKRSAPAKADKNELKTSGRGRRAPGHTLADVVLKILHRNRNGLTLKDIVERVIGSGYKTESKDRGTLSAAVQNCLAKLREKETVVKDEESRRYSAKVA